MSGSKMGHVLGAIRSGQRAEITTPTGKELEAVCEQSEFVIYDSSGMAETGREARERLKKIFRAKETDYKLHSDGESGWPDEDQIHTGTIDVGMKIAALASELGLRADEYEVEDVWVAGEEEIEVDLRELDSGAQENGGDA